MPLTLPTLSLPTLALLGTAFGALGTAGAIALLVLASPLPRPLLGHRGLKRLRALERPQLAALEPAMRLLAAGLRAAVPMRARTHLTLALVHAGDPLGLCAEELLALCAIGGTLGAVTAGLFDAGPLATALALLFGASAPVLRVREQARYRGRAITRRLPPMLDLLGLCMSSGLDFASALELASRELGEPAHPLSEELAHVRQDLALGRSRQRALLALADRVPIAPVQELVTTLVQAEQKGSPLAEVLAIAATCARNRRSVLAEEAAARAAVMLLLPLGILLMAILLVLFGPFLINGIGT